MSDTTTTTRVTLNPREKRGARGWWRRVVSTDRGAKGAYALVGEEPFVSGEQDFEPGTILVECDTDKTVRVLVVTATGYRTLEYVGEDDGYEARWYDLAAQKLSCCDAVEAALASSPRDLAVRILDRDRARIAQLETEQQQGLDRAKELGNVRAMAAKIEQWIAQIDAAAAPAKPDLAVLRARAEALEKELTEVRRAIAEKEKEVL